MSEYDQETGLHLYPISYVLNKPKFDSHKESLGAWIKHVDIRVSKRLGWYCELCGAKSRPKQLYKHTLYRRVVWHINGRCKWDTMNKNHTNLTAKVIYERVKK